jgi:hypothetical protein
MPAWKAICIVLAGMFALAIVISTFGTADDKIQSASGGSDTVTGNPKVTMVDYDLSRGEYNTKNIVGTVRNNTDNRLTYVQVDFNLYDVAGTQVGNAFANVTNLEPHGTWKFSAGVIEENAVTAKLKNVSAY